VAMAAASMSDTSTPPLGSGPRYQRKAPLQMVARGALGHQGRRSLHRLGPRAFGPTPATTLGARSRHEPCSSEQLRDVVDADGVCGRRRRTGGNDRHSISGSVADGGLLAGLGRRRHLRLRCAVSRQPHQQRARHLQRAGHGRFAGLPAIAASPGGDGYWVMASETFEGGTSGMVSGFGAIPSHPHLLPCPA